MQTYLITGATGNVGYWTAKALADRGARVRAAVTDPAKAAGRIPEGSEPVAFDFTKESTYEAALQGVDGVFLLRPPHLGDPKSLYPFIDACKRHGIQHIVFLSLLGAEKNPLPPHTKIEAYLRTSGIPFTFLRPGFFMQNVATQHAEDLVKRNDLFIPAGKGKVSFVDTRDIGEAAAVVMLGRDRHIGQAYELTGLEALSYAQAAAVLSRVLGRTITYSAPSPWKFWRVMTGRGLAKPFVLVMTILYVSTRFGAGEKVSHDLEQLLGRKPTTFEQYAADLKKLFA